MAVKKQPKIIECRGKGVKELNCIGSKLGDTSNWFGSWSPFNTDGVLPYCKDCCEALYKKFQSEGHSMAGSVYLICAMNNVPFIREVYDKSIKMMQDQSNRGVKVNRVFGNYYGVLMKETSKYDLREDFSKTDTDYRDIESNIDRIDIKRKEREQLELDWGKQSTLEDYELLDYWFDKLTDNKPLEISEELLYRDLCLARLQKRKMEQSVIDTNDGSTIDTSKVQKQITELMAKLKIDNFEEKKEQTVVERMLETRIAIQEKEKPASYYSEKKEHEEYLGRSKYFYDHIYRPIMNQFAHNKMYKIEPVDTDKLTDEEYEHKMLKERFDSSNED